jgi:hypothetical protein
VESSNELSETLNDMNEHMVSAKTAISVAHLPKFTLTMINIGIYGSDKRPVATITKSNSFVSFSPLIISVLIIHGIYHLLNHL